MRSLRDLTQHFTTRADDSHAAPVSIGELDRRRSAQRSQRLREVAVARVGRALDDLLATGWGGALRAEVEEAHTDPWAAASRLIERLAQQLTDD